MTAPIALTIIADASYHRQHHTAGWGAWMKGVRTPGAVTMGGQIKELLERSSEAEMRALSNALHVASTRGYIEVKDVVMVQSDCTDALGWILWGLPLARHSQNGSGAPVTRPRKGGRAKDSKGLAAFLDVCQALDLRIVVRHVRGHEDGVTSRSAVNELCDRIAKHHQAERLKGHKREARA